MPRLVLKAFILREEPHLEIDKSVELLTAERGRLVTIAKGAMKVPNRFGAALTPLTLTEATIWESIRGGLTLEFADIIWSSYSLMCSPKAYPFLSASAELFSVMVPENLEDRKSFQLLAAAAPLFSERIPANLRNLFYISVWLTKLHGFLPQAPLLQREVRKNTLLQIKLALRLSPEDFLRRGRVNLPLLFDFTSFLQRQLQLPLRSLTALEKFLAEPVF